MLDEILDIVSDEDIVINQMYRSEVYNLNLYNFRTINAIVINSKKKIWLPIRKRNKQLWPGLLDASVGGHVRSGESYFEAFCRETYEEIRIEINDINWQRIKTLSPLTHKVSSFMHIYLILYDGNIKFNKDDIENGKWYNLQQIIKTIQSNPDIAKPDLLPILELI